MKKNDINECRVALVTSAGFNQHWCGVSESLYQIACNMVNPVFVFTAGSYGLADKLSCQGIPVIILPFNPTEMRTFRKHSVWKQIKILFSVIHYIFKLYKKFKQYKIKIVYLTDIASFIGFFAAKLAGTKVVIGIRGEPSKKKSWLFLYYLCDRIIVLSKEMADKLLSSQSNSMKTKFIKKINVIYNGLNLNQAINKVYDSNLRESIGIGNKDIMLLYVGAIEPRKAQLEFIKFGIPRIVKYNPSIHIVFLGSAKTEADIIYETECRRISTSSVYCEHIHFVGFQQNVWDWYAASDMVVLASRSEGMPRTVIEAMSCGKPVVSYDVCSVKELLQETEAGIVIPQGNIEGIASAIVKLADNPVLRKKMGEIGRVYAASYLDIRQIAKQYDELFFELCR